MSTDLMRQLGELTADERRLLLRRLRQGRDGGGDRPGTSADGSRSLASAQERLWFLDQLDPGDPVYAIPFALRITGPLDPDALRDAVNQVVDRHDALRTTFRAVAGQPRQVVHDRLPIPVPRTDLRQLAEPDRTARTRELVAQHCRHRFVLTEGPLLAARLLTLADDDHLLLVTVHHIVFDGWSTAIFTADLAACYAAATAGRAAELPPLPVRYADWADRERRLVDGPAVADQLDWWRDRLSGAPALSTFAADRPRGAAAVDDVPDGDGGPPPGSPSDTSGHGQRPVHFPAGLAARLGALARQHGTTVNTVLLSGLAALLYRHTGQPDILLGTPVAGRTTAEVEPMIGCFANTVVLRIDLTGDPDVGELIRRTHRTVGDAYARQDVPYVRVVEAVAPPRDPGHNPLFQIMFSVTALGEESHRAGPVTMRPEPVEGFATDFDLFFALTDGADGIAGTAGYDARLFLPGTVDTIVARLAAVLTDFAEHPELTLDRLPSLRRRRITVAASFTGEPVRAPLRFWCDFLRVPAEIGLKQYGEVLPHLLAGDAAPDGTVCLLRWEDWLRHGDEVAPQPATELLDRVVADLGTALAALRGRTAAPVLVGLCPPSAAYAGQPWTRLFARLDDELARICRQLPDVTFLPPAAWSGRYPVAAIHDPQGDKLGQVPYTADFFAAIGTVVARELARCWTPPLAGVVVQDGAVPAAELSRLRDRQARHGRSVVAATGADGVAEAVAARVAAGDDPAALLVLAQDRATARQVAARFPTALVVAVPAGNASRFLAGLWPLDGPAGETTPGPAAALDAGRLEYLAARLDDAARVAGRCRPAARSPRDTAEPPVAARTATERRLAALWSQVLPGATAGVHDDFFAAGGHSLLAVGLLSAVQTEFGRQVALPAFFAGPTIAQLAEVLDGGGETLEPIPVLPRGGDLVPSSTQRRLWAVAQLGDDPTRHNITFAAVLRGRLDEEMLRRAVDTVVARHEILRVTFGDRDGSPVLIVHDRVDCWLPTVDLRDGHGSQRDRAVRAQLDGFVGHRFDLAAGPLLLCRLVRTAADEHWLLVGIHHIVSDHWSWGIFLRELATCYAAEVAPQAGAADALAPLPAQFADVAAWRDGRERQAFDRYADYWRNRLAGAPATLTLPTDRPRPAVRSDRSARAVRTFDVAIGTGLRALVAQEGATLFHAALAGFAALLAERAGQAEVVFGTPVSGRDRPELDDLIGYFADLLPIRVDLAGRPTFRELVRRVRAVVLDAYAHELPFAAIVDAVRPPRNAAHHPVFQCLFNVVDAPDSELTLPGLTVQPVDVPPTGIDFDLFLTLSWRAGEPGAPQQLHATLDHRTDIFDPGTADRLLGDLAELLAAALADPDRPAAVAGGSGPPERARSPQDHPVPPADAPVRDARPRVTVAASFTADPLRDAARHWLGRLDPPAELEFGPYAQVFQQLLDPEAALGRNPDGVNVLAVRWEDWLRGRPTDAPGDLPAAANTLETQLYELAGAVGAFRDRTEAPLTVLLCPASARFRVPPWSGLLTAMDRRLATLLSRHPRVRVLRVAAEFRRYAVEVADDPVGEQWGHLPYTPEAFAVLGTVVAREAYQWWDRPTPQWPADAAAAVRASSAGASAGGSPNGRPGTHQAPRDERERSLAAIYAELLQVEQVGITDSFWDLGGDSMVAIQVVSLAARAGITITPRQILSHPTVAELAALADPAARPAPSRPGGPPAGELPLTPPQHWFFAELAPGLGNVAHFNHPYDLTLRRPVEPAHLRAALAAVVRRHDALRARFRYDGTSWRQGYGPAAESVAFDSHDLTGLSPVERAAAIDRIATDCQSGLDLADGPLVRAAHFRLGGDEPDRLLVVNHHLVVDAMSRGVLLTDLQSACEHLAAGREPDLPPVGTTYLEWAERLAGYADDPAVTGQLDFWLGQDAEAAARLPVDHPDGVTTFASSRTLHADLDEEETVRLRQVARRLGGKLGDLLAAVTACVLADWTGDAGCALAMAAHGRADLFDDVDLTRTVGWFQVYYPLRLDVPRTRNAARLPAVLRQLAAVPGNGVGHGLLRYCHPDAGLRARLAALRPPQVTFNYMGDFSFAGTPTGTDLFDVPDDPAGPAQDTGGRWPYLIDVVPSIVDRRLGVDVNYSANVHRRETIERLLARLVEAIRDLSRADHLAVEADREGQCTT
ncbi:condensation domain-containing protein [Micromonospora sp. NPDC126480]|uniref:condensation domain-containing protein n=1 Tax=Micromonospora sp. NPDC126480 TaxID=3155312 RepID=UPI0033261CA2